MDERARPEARKWERSMAREGRKASRDFVGVGEGGGWWLRGKRQGGHVELFNPDEGLRKKGLIAGWMLISPLRSKEEARRGRQSERAKVDVGGGSKGTD